ncbi:MAG TPA: iron hydrogenase small subunit, partial [Bacillota bacterium]|nr:iron hydrogenase small subunit [Bacillota bacterium]
LKMRKSHDNPAVRELYNDYLIEPLGHKSHELLHTHYEDRGRV